MLYHEMEDQRVLIDLDALHVVVEHRLGEKWITTMDYKFRNQIMLSESFRDQYSYRDSVAALTEWNIDHASPLWTLGHKGGETHWKQR